MAISIGQRFIRRHNAARPSTSNTVAADIAYDTAVFSEGDYAWSAPEVTVDTAGKYLTIFDIGQVDLVSTRAVGTLVPSINTVDQDMYRATHRYLRNSGGSQEGASIGMSILDLAANDSVKVRNPGAGSNGTDALGNYGTNANYGGGFQMIYLGEGNFTEVQRQSNQTMTISYENATRPWTDSTGNWTQITYTNEIEDGDNLYGGTGGDITLKANKKYLVVYGGSFTASSNQRNAHVVRLEINNVNVQRAYGYERNNASDSPPFNGMYLHEVGGSDETLRFYGTVEQEDSGVANTVNCNAFYAQVYELNDSAQWVHVDNGTTDSLDTALANLTTWYDTPLSSAYRSDENSNLSLDAANNAVQNDSGDTLPVLAIGWHSWDRDTGASGARKNPWTQWDNNGASVGYGIAGAYSRGQQGNDDTHLGHYTSAASVDLAASADLKFQVQDEAVANNSNIGIYASTNRHFLGVQVLDLNSLTPTGQIKYWDGTAQTAKPVMVWDGAAWEVKPLKHWNGSEWTETTY